MTKNSNEQRPPVWIGHVAMYSARVNETRDFMLSIGMRKIFANDDFAVLELRGGTHLVITADPKSELPISSFDLMVDDLDVTHQAYKTLGLQPGDIERGQIHDSFEITEPGGTVITFNSTHVGDLPV
ncbi:MAG: hypothetical protein ACI845_002116 [Gammaproteobacteria bacterium]|jgi:hypothetical protein